MFWIFKESEGMDQFKVPCVVYRGGTSRGLFFHEKDLPFDKKIREHIFLKGIGAQDSSHIDGLGAGTSHTSKVVIINESTQKGIDIDYTFIQLGIGNKKIDYEGTCGNLMAATGAFAIDEGIVTPEKKEEVTVVTVWSTNIHKKINIRVPLHQGKAKVLGSYKMTGVSELGASFNIEIENPGGGKTSKDLPIGEIAGNQENGELEYTFSDIVNPFTYLRAKDIGLEGTEPNSDIMSHKTLLNTFEKMRINSSISSGLSPSIEIAKEKYVALPKIAYVSEPKDYKTSEGKLIQKDSYDILARMISMKKMHRTFAVSGLLNLAGTCLLENTIPNEMCNFKKTTDEQIIRIGHPEGIATIKAKKSPNHKSIEHVRLERTVRKIMKGELYIPEIN